MQYAFEYEYTNKEIGWVCTGAGEEQRCHWDNRPDWRAVQKFELGGSIPVDHQQGKVETSDKLDGVLVNNGSWVEKISMVHRKSQKLIMNNINVLKGTSGRTK